MIRTAIYLRVSTDRQAQEGDSIPAQRAALRKYIDDRPDMVCAGEYMDDGISGTRADRDELQRLLGDVKAGKVDRIIVTKLDRLYRSIRHYLNMMEVLDKYGVGWTAIWEPIYDTTTPQGRLVVNQMMSIAQFEAENTGQRVRQVFAYKIQKGEVTTGSCPIGYSIVNKHLVPNDDAEMVRDLFRHYSQNTNLNELVRYAANVYGLIRTDVAIKHMMRNPRYIGVNRDNDHFCEPIIDRELFDDVQRKLHFNRKNTAKREYIFTGMIHCKTCRRNYSAIFIHGYTRYKCQKHYRPAGACTNSVGMSENVIERYLLDNVNRLLGERKLHYEVEAKKRNDSRKKVADLTRKRDRLKDLYLSEAISLDEYKADREKLDAAIAECGNVQPIEPLRPLELPDSFAELYKTFTIKEKRYLWQSVIREIWIGPDRSIDVIFL